MCALYSQKNYRIRRRIIAGVILLSLFGSIMVYSASAIYSWHSCGDSLYYFKRQIVALVIGLAVFFGFLFLDLDWLRRLSKPLIIAGLFMLLLLLVPGVSKKIGGAKRWISLGFFNIQPSEVFKVFFLVYLSDYLCRKKYVLRNFYKGLLPVFLITGFASALIFLEPDLGNALFIMLFMFVFLFVSGVNLKKFLPILALLAVLVGGLILLSPYRRQRVFTFLNPWADIKGKGFQAVESQISFGVGRIFGTGLGAGKQKLFFLPASYTDFIFSIIGEELGLVGSLAVVLFYVWFLFSSFRLINSVSDDFRFYLASGAVFIIVTQAFINMAVAVGLLPTKGLPLPFISYGGSAMLVNYSLLGILVKSTQE